MTGRQQTPVNFIEHISKMTQAVQGRPLDATLDAELNAQFSSDSDWYSEAVRLCRQGVAEGWLCGREAGGIKFGRAVPAGNATHRFSVDVVEMCDVVGPHHAHPNGEIDLIMPLDDAAEFDERGGGWLVYGPGSEHRPTVSNGRALVLYLLPEGAIEFTR